MKIDLIEQIKLQKLLLINGHNQTSFAKKIGITPAYLNQIVNGQRNPSGIVAKKIVDELQVNFDDIFFIQDACSCEQTQKEN